MVGGDQETIGQRIKHERLQLDLSQDELARRLGTNRREIIRWERGHTQPGYKYRKLLGETFGQHPSYFNGAK